MFGIRKTLRKINRDHVTHSNFNKLSDNVRENANMSFKLMSLISYAANHWFIIGITSSWSEIEIEIYKDNKLMLTVHDVTAAWAYIKWCIEKPKKK